MSYKLLALEAAGTALLVGVRWFRYRKEAPQRREIRREARAQDVTFRTRLDRIKQVTPSKPWLGARNNAYLFVRGDRFEIADAIPLLRSISDPQYFFRASETTIQVIRFPAKLNQADSILITGRQSGQEIQVAIVSASYLYETWQALTAAGAIPIGPPPHNWRQHPPTHPAPTHPTRTTPA